MARLESWRALNKGSPDELILTIDFNMTGRKEASFRDLAPKLDQNLTIWESVMPPEELVSGMTGDDYADRWLDECRSSGHTVRAVLGYCVGSVFASVLAARISQWQAQPPRLIVFDPEWPVIPTLYRDFLRSTEQFVSIMPAEDLAAARQAGLAALQDCGDDFGAVGTALVRSLEEPANRALDRLGLTPALRTEFTGAFGSFVSYLTKARQVDYEPGMAVATAITSSRSSGGARLAAREIRFDISHGDMLRDERVAQAVRDVLNGVPSAP
jgi:hypothetical protein